MTFGIMTPGTTKRTTFKEKGCADAWAIVHRKTSDIENYSFHELQIENTLICSGLSSYQHSQQAKRPLPLL
jgi:hypothetical protein